MKWGFILVLVGLLAGCQESDSIAALKTDEHVILYPALATATNGWELHVRGIVYEPERRRLLRPALARALGVNEEELSVEERVIWRQRSDYFLVDNERGKELTLQIGPAHYSLNASLANGHFHASIPLGPAGLGINPEADTNLLVSCQLGAPGTTPRPFMLPVQYLSESGLSIVSDIDDTIKISHVLQEEELIRNTFTRPFQPVPGMAERYSQWARSGAQFHYVTASPWQLYLPLAEFVRSNGFPMGSFHMKTLRVADGSFLALFHSPEQYKPALIESLLAQFPKRRFILIGDSGERDPEVYGALARKHRGRVEKIFIRTVVKGSAESARYQKAFHELPPSMWQIFQLPEEIEP